MFVWKNEEIEKILIQLDERSFPFKKYAFLNQEGRLKLLGRGASALVYEAESREKKKAQYAIKVIGFSGQMVDSDIFRESVEAQKELGFLQNKVVKVYDYMELFVRIDKENRVIAVEKDKKSIKEMNVLKLQFIVMEKVKAVMSYTNSGEVVLTPDKLNLCDETEILHVAYDIGEVLAQAHEKNILHRDVKLENIFYDSKRKCYKLGDFGIAKKTKSGMADTIAYTKGYGAPEVVGNFDDKYDKTADIYSFGILLYVLLNRMRFPDSESYSVNSKMQYSPGYVIPKSENGSDELCRIIEKMCMFYPDDRYQSMDKVLNDLESIIFDSSVGYKKEHKNAPGIAGVICLIFGVIMWKMSLHGVENCRWLAVTLLSLSFFLLMQYSSLCERDKLMTRICAGKDIYWGLISVFYLACFTHGYWLAVGKNEVLEYLLGEEFTNKLATWDLVKVGIAGFAFCIFWIIRERILRHKAETKRVRV